MRSLLLWSCSCYSGRRETYDVKIMFTKKVSWWTIEGRYGLLRWVIKRTHKRPETSGATHAPVCYSLHYTLHVLCSSFWCALVALNDACYVTCRCTLSVMSFGLLLGWIIHKLVWCKLCTDLAGGVGACESICMSVNLRSNSCQINTVE